MFIASQLKKFANILPLFLSGEVMSNTITKKAIQARKWRCKARDKRQLNNIIASYVEHKHKSIYNECYAIYQSIKDKYPNIGPKCNLAKTPTFRRMIQQFDSSDDEATTPTSPATSTETTPASPATSTETTIPASPATSTETTIPASPATSTETTIPASPATSTETTPASPATSTETTPASPTTSTETATPASPATSTETTTTPPSLPSFNETSASASPVQQQIIPVRHLHIGYNALGELVDQITDEGEYVNMDNVNNDVFMDIINELEQDNDVQRLLNNVEVQHLEDPLDMDEGIELGIAGEDDDFSDLFYF